MDDNDLLHLTVVDKQGLPLGYIRRRDAKIGKGTCQDHLLPIPITSLADDNLRVVLSRLYEHNMTWMPVVDAQGCYSGEVSQDYIADYLNSGITSTPPIDLIPADKEPAANVAQAAPTHN